MLPPYPCILFFFFNDTATTEIYTLSLHDALPICDVRCLQTFGARGYLELNRLAFVQRFVSLRLDGREMEDRKSTRLNSSHANISYAVFCLKKKKKKSITQ